MKRFRMPVFAAVISCALFASMAVGEGQKVLTVQGRLTDPGGTPLDGFFDITYRIYTDSTGGTEIWSESHSNVSVTDGLFTVELGKISSFFDVFTDDVVWLETQVESDSPLSPRRQLGSSAHSFQTEAVTASRPIGGSLDTAQAKLEVTDTGASMRLRVVPTSQTTGRISMDVTQTGSQVTVGDLDGDGRLDLRAGPTGAGGGAGGSLSITGDPDFDQLRLSASSTEASVAITGDPDFDLLRLSSNSDTAKISMSGRSLGDPDFDLLRIVGAPSSASLAITGDPDFDMLRMTADPSTASVAITGDPDFDMLRLTADPSSATLAITGDPDFDLLRLSANSDTAKISMSARDAGDPDFDLLSIHAHGTGGGFDLRKRVGSSVILSGSHSIDDQAVGFFTWRQTDGPPTPMISISSDTTSSTATVSNAAGSKGVVTACSPGQSSISATRDGSSRVTISSDDSSSSIAIDEEGVQITMRADTGLSNPSATLTVSNAAGSKGVATGVSPGTTTLRMLRDGAEPVLIACNDDGSSSIAIDEEGVQITMRADSGGTGEIAIDDEGVQRIKISTDSSHSDIAINEEGVQITMRADSGGSGYIAISQEGVKITSTVGADSTGSIAISQEGVKVAELATDGTLSGISFSQPGLGVTASMDSDGDAFLANSLKIGTNSGSNHIEVIGGAYCDGANWVNASDVNSKENFQPVDGEEILERLAELEITRWNYKGKDAAEHIGPTAQDFYGAFGVGTDDKSISTIDPSGIALAAIKELYKKTKEVDDLKKQLAELTAKVEQIQQNLK